jgi:hypothetical protein
MNELPIFALPFASRGTVWHELGKGGYCAADTHTAAKKEPWSATTWW